MKQLSTAVLVVRCTDGTGTEYTHGFLPVKHEGEIGQLNDFDKAAFAERIGELLKQDFKRYMHEEVWAS
jgi:hypothetical protein